MSRRNIQLARRQTLPPVCPPALKAPEVYEVSMTDHLTPEAIATAHGKAADRYAEQLAATRTQRQQQRHHRSKARQVHDRWQGGKREQQRQARAYAEAWWQALRRWETKEVAELVPRTSVGSGGAGRMQVIAGNYGRGQARLTYTEVRTPMGLVSERALARAISKSGSDQLERLRKGTGLASLVRPDKGWADGGKQAAKEVLRVAMVLGDEAAAEHLKHLG